MTKAVGVTHPDRRWLIQLLPFARQLSQQSKLLFDMSYSRYLSLFHLARKLGKQERAHPHQLRHGGASADAMHGASDCSLMERGPWATVRGVARYRKPARYLHQLSLLSEADIRQARTSPRRIVDAVVAMMKGLTDVSSRS